MFSISVSSPDKNNPPTSPSLTENIKHAGEPCQTWPSLKVPDCRASLPALCYLDLTNNIVFPDPADFVRILSEEEMVEFQPCVEAPGWRVNFTIDLWPSSSLSRK